MRISDWSSDVCSSDLCRRVAADIPATVVGVKVAGWFAGEFKQCVVGNGLAGGSGQHGRSRDVLRDGADRAATAGRALHIEVRQRLADVATVDAAVIGGKDRKSVG